MRHVQIGEHLLSDALECGRGDLPSFVHANRRIELYQNGHCGCIDRRESNVGGDQLVRRVVAGRNIKFLRGAGLSCRSITVQARALAGTVEHDALEHAAHRCGSRRPDDSAGLRLWRFGHFRPAAQCADYVWPHDEPAIGHRRHRRNHLQWRHADFLPHGDRSHRNRSPIFQAAKHSAALPGQIDAGRLAETERPDVVIEFGSAQSQADLDRPNVA